jgi:hypothetical protein
MTLRFFLAEVWDGVQGRLRFTSPPPPPPPRVRAGRIDDPVAVATGRARVLGRCEQVVAAELGRQVDGLGVRGTAA